MCSHEITDAKTVNHLIEIDGIFPYLRAIVRDDSFGYFCLCK